MDTPSSGKHSSAAEALEKRHQLGLDWRQKVPLATQGAWQPPANRRDPVEILIEQGKSRIEELLPVRYARMKADPFAFLRGAAAMMAADLSSMPATGLRVQSCGDCHLNNFGAYASPEGTPVFDINDFDETLPAPFEWDLKRLAASFVLEAKTRGLSGRIGRQLARTAVLAYRVHMRSLVALPPLDLWRARADL